MRIRILTQARSTSLRFVAVCSLLIMSSVAHANLIVNGSFETDPFTGSGNYQLGLIGNDVTGWFIPSGDGTYPWGLQNGAFGASTPYGNQFFVLGYWGGPEFSIQQTIAGLSIGATYSLSFAIASENGCCSEAEVSFLAGSSTSDQTFSATASGQYWTDWTTQAMNFVATGNSVTLQFKNVNVSSANGYDLGLDNVIVELASSVPEPTSLLLLGLGLAGLGFVKRRPA